MSKTTKKNLILLLFVIILVVTPFLISSQGTFSGSDDQGTAQILKNDPSYKVWAHPLWTPPSAEIESLLFTLQGSLGTGIIAYVIGSAHGKKKALKQLEDQAKQPKPTTGA
ncbi:energy-coupling factor ABC transporter substrate-binding protein [Levilactobacillus cerevisiae]|uniref:energy-coupling factor ABC transporter substrate-binding protein n=1 Tax=Levilactobacillus cerevisiae TaxID=1704076 RepID=UPI000F77B79B|nr:energy-coupling factor ABC transporter substrate-binding protein [Levilactobacillus cerevisiae]